MKAIERIAPEVGWLPISFVNTYFVGRPGEPWALIDAGLPGSASQILDAAEARFGAGARPEAIYLTHGHFDHRGAALSRSRTAGTCSIYAHRMELPYLTGHSDYPPARPDRSAARSRFSRAFCRRVVVIWASRLRELAGRRILPGLEGWRWTETPGHAPGHVSYLPARRIGC